MEKPELSRRLSLKKKNTNLSNQFLKISNSSGVEKISKNIAKRGRNARGASISLGRIAEPSQEQINLVEDVNKIIIELSKKKAIKPTISNWRDEHK